VSKFRSFLFMIFAIASAVFELSLLIFIVYMVVMIMKSIFIGE